eukprot:CAMPEP_0167790972 /NCGR_PEP_ID=MMETSP0111_2-20121227/11638_1 /TAXON_ID=91324 /ORGANISM="Lotharella globosa, Strain CCCM811" /LENGTH=159 /DNA_ID=CAMNT_0007683511 /DNA_START=1047 /DNA_END=1526 /DNA_ORIENTATION=+
MAARQADRRDATFNANDALFLNITEVFATFQKTFSLCEKHGRLQCFVDRLLQEHGKDILRKGYFRNFIMFLQDLQNCDVVDYHVLPQFLGPFAEILESYRIVTLALPVQRSYLSQLSFPRNEELVDSVDFFKKGLTKMLVCPTASRMDQANDLLQEFVV